MYIYIYIFHIYTNLYIRQLRYSSTARPSTSWQRAWGNFHVLLLRCTSRYVWYVCTTWQHDISSCNSFLRKVPEVQISRGAHKKQHWKKGSPIHMQTTNNVFCLYFVDVLCVHIGMSYVQMIVRLMCTCQHISSTDMRMPYVQVLVCLMCGFQVGSRVEAIF